MSTASEKGGEVASRKAPVAALLPRPAGDTVKLDCGIAQRRITAWLDDELALARHDDGWTFDHAHGSCRIKAEPLESRALGSVALERTLVTIEGDDAAIDELYRLFTLRFVSAGG